MDNRSTFGLVEPEVGQLFSRQRETQPVLVYIHGFDNTLESAVHLANHVANKIKFDGDLVVFAWPSQGTLSAAGYRADVTAVEPSKSAFSDLLQTLIASPLVDRIHIISHSLGNRLLIGALVNMTHVPKLGQIVICSPDLERAEFLRFVPQVIFRGAGSDAMGIE